MLLTIEGLGEDAVAVYFPLVVLQLGTVDVAVLDHHEVPVGLEGAAQHLKDTLNHLLRTLDLRGG